MLLTALLVLAIAASSALVVTNRVELLKLVRLPRACSFPSET